MNENCETPFDFINCSGYTDYIHADIIDTLCDYGFDDVMSGYTGFSIEWDTLIKNLYEMMSDRIHLSEGVIEHDKKNRSIRTEKRLYHYDTLICSTPVSIAQRLFPSIRTLRDLACQPFSRIYAKIGKGKKEMAKLVTNFTIVDSYLQKIIPINSGKGIYMIGYNDNYDAEESFNDFQSLSEPDLYHKISSELLRIFGIEVTIRKAKIAFWEDGTTYYKPLRTSFKDRKVWLKVAQHPSKNLYFIGEGFSRNQGWVQGSLESVDAILKSVIQ